MSVMEAVRSKVKELTDKSGPAGDLLNSAKTAMVHGLDGASKFVDQKTHGKYTSVINTGVGKAKDLLGENEARPEQPTDAETKTDPPANGGSPA